VATLLKQFHKIRANFINYCYALNTSYYQFFDVFQVNVEIYSLIKRQIFRSNQ